MSAAGSVPSAALERPSREAVPLHPGLVALVAVAGGLLIGGAATLGPVPAVGALLGSVAGFYFLRRPAIAAIILVGAVPALSGLTRGLPVPGLRISEVLVGALSIAILLTVPRGQAARWGLFDWMALVYASGVALLGGVALLLRGEAFSPDNIAALLGPFQFLLLYRAVRTAVRTERHRILALRMALLAAIPVCLLAFVQVADVGGVRELLFTVTAEPGADDLFADAEAGGVSRVTGPFVIWHTLSAYLWLISLVAAGLLLRGDRRVLPAGALIAVLAMAAAAILLTVSATPLMALVAGVLWLAHRHGQLGRVVLLVIVGGVVGAAALGPSIAARSEQQQVPESVGGNPLVPQTIAFRYEVWTEQYFPVIERNLITGYGPGIPPEVTWESTESIYVTMLMRGGIPLLIIYLALTLSLLAWARTARRAGRAPVGAAVAEAMAVAVVILYAYQALIPLFMITGMPHLLWALAGLMPAADSWASRDVRVSGTLVSSS